MSFVKSQLKLARDLVGKKNYTAAQAAAEKVLEYEPENYTASVFLALIHLELGEIDKSEQAYRRALAIQPELSLAWQGLSRFYERTERWDKYTETLDELAKLYAKSDDAIKCAETLEKLIAVYRTRGNIVQLADALTYLLPGSALHDVLATLPPPDQSLPSATTTLSTQLAIYNTLPILEEVISLIEKHEEETLRTEIDKGRFRLGAAQTGPEQLKKESGRRIWSLSRLPSLYNEVLIHPNTSDELRRETEAKFLRYKRRYLYSLPNSEDYRPLKSELAREVDELVGGIVLLKLPDELAWVVFFEGKDYVDLDEYDVDYFKHFIELFPLSSMASLLSGYLMYNGLSLSNPGEPTAADADGDAFDLVVSAYPAVSSTLLGNRIMGKFYLDEEDFENAIKIANNGLEVLNKEEDGSGKELRRTRTGFQVVLATSLVHLFPPKHHTRALSIIDEVLSHSPDNVLCLMGRAYIQQNLRHWEEAETLFNRVGALIPDNIYDGFRAREEGAWCKCHAGGTEEGLVELYRVLDDLEVLEGRTMDAARCLWRIGKCHWDMGGTKREIAYKLFITSLKRNSSFAPSYTSLGLYYIEQSSPSDPVRASKCFQKAFELDPREAEAAKRLAEGFADEKEWDLVEVVARRTIDGEGGLDAGLKGAETTAKYQPTNAWAWKAVGVVELNRRNFAPSIQAFQTALRADPDDQSLWVRLGEAYNKAGRHAAAVKALNHALKMHPDDWTCKFFIGDVKHQLGLFSEAISIFESILLERPSEVGVLASLGQSFLNLGRAESSEGFYIRAEESLVRSIRIGLKMISESPGFRNIAWKIIADAVFHLSYRSKYAFEENVFNVVKEVVVQFTSEPSDRLADIIPIPSFQEAKLINGIDILKVAIHAYNYRISIESTTLTSNGSIWYDLGIALCSWVEKSPGGINASKAKGKAIEFLTKALHEDASNDAYWTALGNAQFISQPKAAQHAYLKALEVDSKSVASWTNLGLLYLHHGDIELANEALYRAQVLDPDYAVAWIGQAIVAIVNGHDADARALLEHGVGLTASVLQADYDYASRMYSSLKDTEFTPLAKLLPAFFVLDRYCARLSNDADGLHLFALVCEAIGHVAKAEELVRRVIGILETAYEDTEDPVVERQYTIANVTLGRLRLSLGNYEDALESFEAALGLLTSGEAESVDQEEAWIEQRNSALRVRLLVGAGLSHLMMRDFQSAIDDLQIALNSATNDPGIRGHIVVLLAKTMWAIGTEESKESAKGLLLECVSEDPRNISAISTLAALGILTQDDSLVDAALSEILALPLQERYQIDPERTVEYLLFAHYMGQGNINKLIALVQTSVFVDPSRLESRNKLATLMLQAGYSDNSLALLRGSMVNNVNDIQAVVRRLSLLAVSRTRTDSQNKEGVRASLRDAQRAVMLSPSQPNNWRALGLVHLYMKYGKTT